MAFEALGGDHVAGQGELQRNARRDKPREAEQATDGRGEAAFGLGQAELGIPGCDDEVAGQHGLEAAGERVAFHCCDEGLARRGKEKTEEATARDTYLLAAEEGLEVHAGAEVAAGAGEDADMKDIGCVEFIERSGDTLGECAVDCVALVRSVDGYGDQAGVATDEDFVGHGVSPPE